MITLLICPAEGILCGHLRSVSLDIDKSKPRFKLNHSWKSSFLNCCNRMNSVSYTHLDVYKRQVLHDGKTFAVNQRFVPFLHHNPVLRLLLPNGADFEAVVLLLGSYRPGINGIHHDVLYHGEIPHIQMCIRDRFRMAASSSVMSAYS